MSDSFVTQCPHCRTSFRVSQVQLSAAQGAVRCGACLHVFNAHQHLLDKPLTAGNPGAAPATPASPAATSLQPAPDQAATETLARKDSLDTVRIHDDLDLDSLDLDEELARLEQEEQLHSRSRIPLESPASRQPAFEMAPATEAKADERWAEKLLEDSQRPANASSAAPAATTTELAEPPAEPASTGPWQDSDDDTERLEPAIEDEHTDEAEDQHIDMDIQAPAPAGSTDEADTTTRFRPNDKLLELDQDPLQLQWQAPGRPWGRWLGWGLLNLIAAGALITQYTFYHFDELARQDQYRPWFESICPQLGCSLPPKVDVNLIKSSNLVIRSHPDFAGALVVDAILYNRASFEQPFPLLELRFSDINNKPLANRRFKPSEYLAGELAGQSQMPPQTPIHISLDILDPGQEAVNYNLIFQSPE
jgi:predicted Zn finger-like uncharacterized protein